MIKNFFAIFGILLLLISNSYSKDSKEITWSDLVPWTNVFTPNEVKFNKKLDGKTVKIPGYIVPLDHIGFGVVEFMFCLLYTSPSPRDRNVSRMPSSA